MKSKINYDVVIIDSGVTLFHSKEKITGIFLDIKETGEYCLSNDLKDEINHGTGIYGVIKQHNQEATIFNIKICDNNHRIPTIEDLYYALSYIKENINCKIINMSLAINLLDNIQILEKLEYMCNYLMNQGIILVSAFDNLGSISYPAAFNSVIGVTSGYNCQKITDIEYIGDIYVDVAGKGNEQKVISNKGNYMLAKGNSLACAHITGMISSHIVNNKNSKKYVLDILRRYAIQIFHSNDKIMVSRPCFDNFQKVVIFPFNKEMHSLIRFQDMLKFKIIDIYDIKYSGYVHSSVNQILNIDSKKNYNIKNIEYLDYESFDTLIIGCTDKIETIENIKQKIDIVLKKCVEMGKNIYSFDDRENDLRTYQNYFSPKIRKNVYPSIAYGKLFRNPKPVVGIFGTSSRQGKFSLQLILRRELLKKGYLVGQIGSEPTSLLFGMDESFHFGYNANPEIARYDTVSYLNYAINNLVKKDIDLIIVGCQSRTIPIDNGNLNNFTFAQIEFLFATQPDVIVLCINPWDDYTYIYNTIQFIKSAVNANTVALVVYPFDIELNSQENCYTTIKLTSDKYNYLKIQLEKQFLIPVFNLDYKQDYERLTEVVIEVLQ